MSNYSYLLSDYFWLYLIVEYHAPQQISLEKDGFQISMMHRFPSLRHSIN